MSNYENPAEQARAALSGLSANVTPNVSSGKREPYSAPRVADLPLDKQIAGTRRLMADVMSETEPDYDRPSTKKAPLPQLSAQEWMNVALVHQFSMAQRRPSSMAFGGKQHLMICEPGSNSGFQEYDSYPSWYSEVDRKPTGGPSKEAMEVRDFTFTLAKDMCRTNPLFVNQIKGAPTLDEALRRCEPLTTYALGQYRELGQRSNMSTYEISESVAKNAATLDYRDADFVQSMVKTEGPALPPDPCFMTDKMVDAGDIGAGRARARSMMRICPVLQQYDPDGSFMKQREAKTPIPPEPEVKKKSSFYHNVRERLFSGKKQGLNEVEQPAAEKDMDNEFI